MTHTKSKVQKLWKWKWNYWQVVDVVVDGIPQKPGQGNFWINKFEMRHNFWFKYISQYLKQEKSWFTDFPNIVRHFESKDEHVWKLLKGKLTLLFHSLHQKHLSLKWLLVSPSRGGWFSKTDMSSILIFFCKVKDIKTIQQLEYPISPAAAHVTNTVT